MSNLYHRYLQDKIKASGIETEDSFDNLHLLHKYSSPNKLDTYNHLDNNLEHSVPQIKNFKNKHNNYIFDSHKIFTDYERDRLHRQIETRNIQHKIRSQILIPNLSDIRGETLESNRNTKRTYQ